MIPDRANLIDVVAVLIFTVTELTLWRYHSTGGVGVALALALANAGAVWGIRRKLRARYCRHEMDN